METEILLRSTLLSHIITKMHDRFKYIFVYGKNLHLLYHIRMQFQQI
jgi:hypothetical protein